MKSPLVASVGTYSYDSQHLVSEYCPGVHTQHTSLPLPNPSPGLVAHNLFSRDGMLAHHTLSFTC